ncbi:MAG: antitoxin VapB family protein [Nanoarchaeota archaeon]
MTKNIAIMDKAYDVLTRHKLPGESFSQVILREFEPQKSSWTDYIGTFSDISDKEAAQMQADIKRARKLSDTKRGDQ